MPSALPTGDPAPPDGRLPGEALTGLGDRPFGLYVHVPFCRVRCGYCDFNTYTVEELGPGASRASYAASAIAEIRWARQVLGDVDLPVSTVFLGGGTPTLLPPGDLGAVLAAIGSEFGFAPDAEITTESNPDSVAAWDLEQLRGVGFNRISFGMQSAVPHVLATLDRTHDPLRVPAAVAWARAAGFDQVSLDLIYGTPGESLPDWETSLEAALACEPDHVSAYALIVEEGTALARAVRRHEIPAPDDDDLADKYLAADERLAAAGLRLVRGVELGPRRGRPVPPQPPLLDRRRLVGRRSRRPLARRRGAVVERQAPRGVRRPAGVRHQPGPRAGAAVRGGPPGRAGAAGAAARHRPRSGRARRRRSRGGA